jgi:hypothetical protein
VKTNYLLIDYENVQPRSLSALNSHPFRVVVFLGANQAKVPVEFARALQELGANAEYVQISGNGRNAVDFHIAFTIGELSRSDPAAYFHIVSRDTGFDPLIAYLRARGILAQRSKEVADIPILKVSNATTLEAKMEAIVRNLRSRGSGRPRKVKTLSNTINAVFLKSLGPSDLATLVEELVQQGFISIDGEHVSYHFPDST